MLLNRSLISYDEVSDISSAMEDEDKEEEMMPDETTEHEYVKIPLRPEKFNVKSERDYSESNN